jgi:hypothetical protein
MSTAIDRLQVVAAQQRAAADVAVADAEAAEKALADELALEAAQADANSEKLLHALREAEAAAAAMGIAAPVALDAQPVAMDAALPGQATAAPGPSQQSPEQLLAADQAASVAAPEE